MKKSPTFEQLRVKRKLHVVNPDNGKRFTVSLRDWRECLWGIRVIPDVREPSDKFNGFVKKPPNNGSFGHRRMAGTPAID